MKNLSKKSSGAKKTEFASLIKHARKQARETGMKKDHVKKAIAEVRKNNDNNS